MRIPHGLMAVVVCATGAARAADVEPLITRPATLPRGALDVTLQGTYTNWSGTATTAEGETVAAGVDFGVTDRAQLGVALAFPVNPNGGFGSVVGSGAFSTNADTAFRIDAGYENFRVNVAGLGSATANRFFGGLGARFRIPLSPTVAFVTGRVGTVHFGHFNNLGTGGFSEYVGASLFTEAASDFFVVSGGDNGSPTDIGFNLPAGLLVQPDPHIAITLQAGYSTVVETAQGSTASLHFIPLALEVVVSPAAAFDVGFRFFLDGFVGSTGTGFGPGYFDTRALMFWLRARV
jgi:hypothetical protein